MKAILGRGDIDGLIDHSADDTVMIEAESLPYGGTYTGKDKIRAGLNKVFPFYSSFPYKPEVLTANGEWVIAYGEFAVTSASIGHSIAFSRAEVSRVVDGKIVTIHPV